MKTPKQPIKKNRANLPAYWLLIVTITILSGLPVLRAKATTAILFTNNFDSYTGAAVNFSDTTVAIPNTDQIKVEDGQAFPDSPSGLGYDGVQLINWNSHSAPNSMLLRPNTSFRCNINPRTGTNYVWDFWMLSSKSGAADRGFRISLVGEGADLNEQDVIIFRSGQNPTTNAAITGIDGVDIIQAFNGILGTPNPNAWVTISNNASTGRCLITNNVWNHFKIEADAAALTFKFYFNDMTTPYNSIVQFARPQQIPVSAIRFANEGNSADDGYTLIDDVSLTVDGNLVDLATGPFTEGFENYPASTSATTNSADSDPQGPWITAETAAGGQNQAFAPQKVQVVDSSVTTPHSGNKCLMVQGGQVGGVSLSWAQPTNEDVKITWWAKVPETPGSAGVNQVYLRMSLYGWEAGSSSASDTVLLGYGHRSAAPTGGTKSILGFSRWASDWFGAAGAWLDTSQTYTPDVWEQYQLTTHVSQNSYSISNLTQGVSLIKDGQFTTAWTGTKKMHTIGFSSSNGTGHPPAFIDDLTIQGFTSTEEPQPRPYTPTITGNRFTNYTVLEVPGHTVGGVCVDPRDNTSIIFTVDEEQTGAIRRAHKVASGNWVLDPQPIVSGLDFPSGITMETNGTIWWVHDNVKGGFYMALRRLKAPWTNNAVEEIISDFGPAPVNGPDQPCDLTFVPSTFSGSKGSSPMLAVLDRGVNGNNPNAIWLVNPADNNLNQTVYANALAGPDNTLFGFGLTGNANAIAPLAVSGELVTIWEGDGINANGVVAAFDGNGVVRYIDTSASGVTWGAGIAVDPTTSRIWIADQKATTIPSAFVPPQIVSIDSTNGAFIQELTFPNLAPTTDRPDRRIDFHDPGMTFSTNGSFLVVSDQALSSDGGRLVIFHNEPFMIPNILVTQVTRTNGSINLSWTSGGAVNYIVQRSSTVNGNYLPISGTLMTTQFSDSNPPADQAFYRVLTFPQN